MLCCSKRLQKKEGIDIGKIRGFVGIGGPYGFSVSSSRMVKILENILFRRGYDRKKGDPCILMEKTSIPMLLIQSRHDGLISFDCALKFKKRAKELGNFCELYEIEEKRNTHSWYTAGIFLETREKNRTLDRMFSWIDKC